MIGQNKPCNCCLSGKVLDVETNQPIPYATVLVKNTEKYAQTDEKGDFVINGICPDDYTLVISCVTFT